MSYKKLSLLKLKKKCQEKLYNSIESTLELQKPQTYLPAFTGTLNFENHYSKKMFIFNSKFVLLEVDTDKSQEDKSKDSEQKPENNNEKKPSRLTFPIHETLQGNVVGKVVNNKLYQKSKTEEDYVRFVGEIPMFLKSNPLIDVISYMEGKYDFNTSIPSIFSLKTNKKINDVNNNAYLEVICAYYLNLLQENKKCSLFPNFYGGFNGIAKNYVHDISEDYPHIRNTSWFCESSEELKYEIIRNNNLEGYQDLSFKNIEKIDYSVEKDNQYKKSMEMEINNLEDMVNVGENNILNKSNLSKLDSHLEISLDEDLDLEEINFVPDDFLDDNNSSLAEEIDLNLESKKLMEIDNDDENNSEDEMSIDSGSCFSSLSSDGSCIFAETFLKIRDFPVQVLAMEKLDITLTELVKQDRLGLEDWRSHLFEICFGLAVAQKNYSFIHNDLHSDNIMFKPTKIENKYYQYQDTYFKVPTYSRETKVIDFARGILKVGKKTYFSDVFKNDGDAGGQYNYLNKQKSKKFNFHFDLARLATTIYEFTGKKNELNEVNKLLMLWTESKIGESFLEMEDNFSLYVAIAETACNALPKDQLSQPIFKKFQIELEDIPEDCYLYKY